MALIQCTECGRDVSDRAESCPNCGMSINSAPPSKHESSSNSNPAHSFLLAGRKEHLLGIAGFAGIGLITLADEDLLTGAMALVGIAIAVYLLVVIIRQLFALKKAPPHETHERMFELVEVVIYSVLLSMVAGFWSGFTSTIASVGNDVEAGHAAIALLFGSTTAIGIGTSTVAGLACLLRAITSHDAKSRSPERQTSNKANSLAAVQRGNRETKAPAIAVGGENE
jgi:chromate transport protein ChrA